MAAMTFGGALVQLWSTIGTVLSAVEFFAKGAKNLGEWTDETTKSFVDESRIKRQRELAKMEAELAEEQATANAKIAAAQSPAPALAAPAAKPAAAPANP